MKKKDTVDRTSMGSASGRPPGAGVTLTQGPRLGERLRSRRDGIYEEPLGNQIILFDSVTRESATLDAVAAFVWTRCDGRTTVAEIVGAFENANFPGQGEMEVFGAINRLAGKGLLLDESAIPLAPGPPSRRAMLNYGALAAKMAILFPALASILGPSGAEAASVRTPRSVKPRTDRGSNVRRKNRGKGQRGKGRGNQQGNGPTTNNPPAVVDCYGGWGEWGECDFFMQAREYTVMVPAANGGLACEVEDGTVETQDCGALPVDCAGTWGAWSSCSVSCGDGTQARAFNITTPAANGGAACPSPEYQSCDAPPCAVVCPDCFEASDRCQPDGSCIHLCPPGTTGDCCTSQDGGATFFNDC